MCAREPRCLSAEDVATIGDEQIVDNLPVQKTNRGVKPTQASATLCEELPPNLLGNLNALLTMGVIVFDGVHAA